MISFVIRLAVTALALWVAAQLVGGVSLADGDTGEMLLTLALVALVLTAVNAVLKPIVTFLSLPLVLLTLGLFMFVINALMLMLTSWLSGQLGLAFSVDGFGAALLGSIVVTVVSWLVSILVPKA